MSTSTHRRRAAVLFLGALTLGLLTSFTPPRPAWADAPPVFRLIHVADSHWIAGQANTPARQALATIAQLSPPADLMVHGGDVAEVGATQEYDEWEAAYKQVLPYLPARYVPGNHDGRWLDGGLAQFRAHFGAAPQSFTAAGVHFVLLDSSITAETHGHFDRTELAWLDHDLATAGPNTPSVLFFHHPVAYTALQFTDTDDELFATIAPYNVRAIFTGHGHINMRWQRNNIPLFMTEAALTGGFKVIDVLPDRLRVEDGHAGQPLQELAEVPLVGPRPDTQVAIQSVAPQADGNWRVTVQAAGLPLGTKVWYQIDSGDWYPATQGPDGLYSGAFSVLMRSPGSHRVHVWAAPPDAAFPGQSMTAQQWIARDLGPSWSDSRDFTLAGGPGVAWRYQAPAGIQAPPAVGGGKAFVADRSGRVTALDVASGSERWRVETGAAIVGSPSLSGSRLAVADTSGTVRVLDAATGADVWSYQAAAPVLGQPLWAADALIFGDAAGNLYALDQATGALRWRMQAGATIRAGVTYGAGAVCFGAWDGTVYAVDAFTGQVRWKQRLPGQVYYAPANQSPLYYRDMVYVTRVQPTGGSGLYALDGRDGHIRWQVPGGFGYSAPILHAGAVAVATGGGSMYGFDPLTGARQWVGSAGMETFDGALSSVGSQVVLSSLSGVAAGYETKGSQAIRAWRYSTGSSFNYARPVPAQGLVLVGSMDGTLVALSSGGNSPSPLTLGTPGDDLLPKQPATFPDVAGTPESGWIGLGQQMELVTGFADGGFHPNASLTRAQEAVLVARYLGLTTPSKGFVSSFADIRGHWAAPYIQALEEKGLITGVQFAGHSYYQPDRAVTRAEVAAMVARMLGRPAPSAGFASRFGDLTGHWSASAVGSLEEMGLLGGEVGAFAPGQASDRAFAVTLLVHTALGD